MGGSKLGAFTGLPRAFPAFICIISRASSLISVLKPETISRFKVSISPCDRKLPDVECGMVGDADGGGPSCCAGASCPNEALRSDLSMSLFKLSMCPVVRAASLLRSSLSSYLEHKQGHSVKYQFQNIFVNKISLV